METSKHKKDNRSSANQLAIDAAMKGNGICGAAFTLDALAHAAGFGHVVTMVDNDGLNEDEDDWSDIRPY